MSDDVIDLDAARKAAVIVDEPSRVLRRRRDDGKRGFCRHRHFAVSMDEAEIECSDCKAALDPWTVLRQLATEHENLWVALSFAKNEKARLEADIKMLKEQRAKLRKQVPKAEERTSMEPTEAHRWRVHAAAGRMGRVRVSPWMAQVDAQRVAKRLKGRVEEAPVP